MSIFPVFRSFPYLFKMESSSTSVGTTEATRLLRRMMLFFKFSALLPRDFNFCSTSNRLFIASIFSSSVPVVTALTASRSLAASSPSTPFTASLIPLSFNPASRILTILGVSPLDALCSAATTDFFPRCSKLAFMQLVVASPDVHFTDLRGGATLFFCSLDLDILRLFTASFARASSAMRAPLSMSEPTQRPSEMRRRFDEGAASERSEGSGLHTTCVNAETVSVLLGCRCARFCVVRGWRCARCDLLIGVCST